MKILLTKMRSLGEKRQWKCILCLGSQLGEWKNNLVVSAVRRGEGKKACAGSVQVSSVVGVKEDEDEEVKVNRVSRPPPPPQINAQTLLWFLSTELKL